MEEQETARTDFKPRRGVRGKLRVWQWVKDPRITIRERLNASGGVGYRVTLPKGITGGPVLFLQSRDFEAAKELARSKGREFRESRSTALVLSDTKKIQAASAIRTLDEHAAGLGLDEVARQFCAASTELKVHGLSVPDGAKALAEALRLASRTGKPLNEVVQFAVARLCPEGGTKTLADLANEMIDMKRGWFERGDLRPASFRDFDDRAGKIRDEIGSFPLPDLTKQILYDWLNGLDRAPRTKKNYRMILAEMLSYAKQKRYIAANPMEELTRQDIKEIEGAGGASSQPEILSPADAQELLTAAFANPDLDLGAAVALGLFGGIRTEELKRLAWDAVRLEDAAPFVVIGPEIAKKRRIRNVPLPDCAVAWLRRWQRGEKVTRSAHANDYQKRFMKLCRRAAITWSPNLMRHSFASYHYARNGNSIETARILGHRIDDATLFAHYRALATKEQGVAYFSIFPKTAEGVIEFSSAAQG